MARRFVCEDCSHTWVPPAFQEKLGAHCPKCKSAKITEENATPKPGVDQPTVGPPPKIRNLERAVHR